jgi:murein DD-endopeptidase MepM/ murein hydrolase activator NlpD
MRLVFRPHLALFFVVCALALGFTPPLVHAAPPLGSPDTHMVQAGETLYSIALHYHTTVAVLKQLNGLKSDTIQVGQKLVLPGAETPASTAAHTTPYIVQVDDTLDRIAVRYGTTLRALEELNGIANPNLLSAGQALVIPGSDTLVKPGLTLDPQVVPQGGTLFVQVASLDLASVSGSWNNATVPFMRAAGYFYALIGISRCAKLGALPLKLTETNAKGQTATENVMVTVTATAFPVQNLTLTGSTAALLEPSLVTREENQLQALVKPHTAARLWSGVFRQPLIGTVTSYFGTRRSYNGGPVSACGHEGMDLAVAGGTPIHSDARGRVIFAGLTQVRGNMVVVDHGLGVYTAYYHQSEMLVKVGQMVQAGDLIGKVGTTGLSTGNHLHWSVFVNGEYVDPVEWTRRMIP